MSSCGYYKVHKGKMRCEHPEKGEDYTKALQRTGRGWHPCDLCRLRCGGIYPSQLPKANQAGWQTDILDTDGTVILENYKPN